LRRLRIAPFGRWVACGFLALGWCLGIALFLVLGYVRDLGLVLDLARATPAALEGRLSADDQASVWWAYEFALKCPELIALRNGVQGDPRIIAVVGFSRFFPGLPDSPVQLGAIDLYDDSIVRLNGGVGDSGTACDFLFQSAFYDYAFRYNRAIWPFLRTTFPDRRFGMELSWGEAAPFCNQGPWTGLPPEGPSGGVRQAAIEVFRFGANDRVYYLKGTVQELSSGQRTLVAPPEVVRAGQAHRSADGSVSVRFRDFRGIWEGPAFGTEREESLQLTAAGVVWCGKTFEHPSWLAPENFEAWFFSYLSRPDVKRDRFPPPRIRTKPTPFFSGDPSLYDLLWEDKPR